MLQKITGSGTGCRAKLERMNMKRILLTGASGFVGQSFLRKLAASGQGSGVTLLPLADAVDIRDIAGLADAIAAHAPDAVLHLAAISHVPTAEADPQTAFDVNVRGTLALMQALRQIKFAGRVLHVSSADVYGRVLPAQLPLTELTPAAPVSIYGSSKLASEVVVQQAARRYGTDVVIARSFNHVGAGQSADFVLPAVARQIARVKLGLQAPELLLGDVDVERDFLDVGDVLDAYLAIMESGRTGEVYNVCSGEPRNIRATVEAMLDIAQVRATITHDVALYRPAEQKAVTACHEKLTAHTGWRPRIAWRDTLASLISDWSARVPNESAAGR
ncbi:MAG: GDP-mannose 4,6-dehydratase [Casimicrobium sp.]